LTTIWIAPWHSRLVWTVFAVDAVVEMMEELVFFSEAREPTPIRAKEPMCVVSHQAFELMMQIGRVDMSHEKTIEEMRMQWRDCFDRQSRFKGNAVSEIAGRWGDGE